MHKKNHLKSPSVTSNTYFVFLALIISFILGTVFFILSIGLLLESAFEYKYFINIILFRSKISTQLPDTEIWKIATVYGFFSLFMSLFFLFNTKICRMVLVRNHYIMELQENKK